jgi:hypothetical protein
MMINNELERCDLIVLCAWQVWTKNGLGLDADEQRETKKTVQDAARNTYFNDISTPGWLTATLARLGVGQYGLCL